VKGSEEGRESRTHHLMPLCDPETHFADDGQANLELFNSIQRSAELAVQSRERRLWNEGQSERKEHHPGEGKAEEKEKNEKERKIKTHLRREHLQHLVLVVLLRLMRLTELLRRLTCHIVQRLVDLAQLLLSGFEVENDVLELLVALFEVDGLVEELGIDFGEDSVVSSARVGSIAFFVGFGNALLTLLLVDAGHASEVFERGCWEVGKGRRRCRRSGVSCKIREEEGKVGKTRELLRVLGRVRSRVLVILLSS
jgi:hypothetical protein